MFLQTVRNIECLPEREREMCVGVERECVGVERDVCGCRESVWECGLAA